MVDTVISGSSIEDTHKILEASLLSKGNRFESQRKEVVELLNVHSVVRFPLIRGNHDYWYGDKLESYIDQWFRKDRLFAYTYGDRIVNLQGFDPNMMGVIDNKCCYRKERRINQLDFIINELKQAPNSRRAMIIIYNPSIDNGREDVPCLQTLQYQIRDNFLFTTVQYRSHDIDAYYPNLCGIAEVSKYIAYKVDPRVYVGEINVYSNNLHKYLSEL